MKRAATHDVTFETFRAGDYVVFEKRFNSRDLAKFVDLSGDHNPLHGDADYAAATSFGAPIAPLFLTAAPLSAIAGMMIPGHRSLILSSSLNAHAPVPFDKDVTYSARVRTLQEAEKVLILDVIGFVDNTVALSSEMIVKVRTDVDASLAPARDKLPPIRNVHDSRTAFITGATGQIGRAIARALAAAGWSLLLHSRTKSPAADDLAKELHARGASVSMVHGDLTDPQAVARMVKRIGGADNLEAVVHTAAQPVDAPLDRHMATTFEAYVALSRAATRPMLKRQRGTALIIGTSAMQYGLRGWDNYLAAKAAAANFAQQFNRTYGTFGVRASVLAPGYVDTPYSDSLRPDGAAALLPEEVAEAAVSTLSDSAADAPYIWLEPGMLRVGDFGFHDRTAASAFPSARPTPAPARAEASAANAAGDLDDVLRAVFHLAPSADVRAAAIGRTPRWDSLKHIELMLKIEQRFGVHLDSQDFQRATDYASLSALLADKGAL